MASSLQTDWRNESSPSQFGLTPLHEAARKGRSGAVDVLLAGGARLEAADKWGVTPLIEAASSGHAPVVARLIAAGARLDATTTVGAVAVIFVLSHSLR
jgi:ankyrin repeat protein